MSRHDMSALADQPRAEGQVIDSLTQRRSAGEDGVVSNQINVRHAGRQTG